MAYDYLEQSEVRDVGCSPHNILPSANQPMGESDIGSANFRQNKGRKAKSLVQFQLARGYLSMGISLLDVKTSTCIWLTYLVLSYFATKDRLSHRETKWCLNTVHILFQALNHKGKCPKD